MQHSQLPAVDGPNANDLIETYVRQNGRLRKPSVPSVATTEGPGVTLPVVIYLKSAHYGLLSRAVPDQAHHPNDNTRDRLVDFTSGHQEPIVALVVYLHEDVSSPRTPLKVAVMDSTCQLFCCSICRNADGDFKALQPGCLISLQPNQCRVIELFHFDLASIRAFVHVFAFQVPFAPVPGRYSLEKGDHYFAVAAGAIDLALSFGEAVFLPSSLLARTHEDMAEHIGAEIENGLANCAIVNAELLHPMFESPCPSVSEEGKVEFRKCNATSRAVLRPAPGCTCLTEFGINGCIAVSLPPCLIEKNGCGVPKILKIDKFDAKSYCNWYSHNIPPLPTARQGALPPCLWRAIRARVVHNNQETRGQPSPVSVSCPVKAESQNETE